MKYSQSQIGSLRASVCLGTALALSGIIVGCGSNGNGYGQSGAAGSGNGGAGSATGSASNNGDGSSVDAGNNGHDSSTANAGDNGQGGSVANAGDNGQSGSTGRAGNSGTAGGGSNDGGAATAGSDGGAPADRGTSGPVSPWPALAQPAIVIQGGSATSAGGQAQTGGTVHLVSQGGVSLDPTLQLPPASGVATPPTDATAVTTATLDSDLSITGSATIDGMITSGGQDAVRQISAGGDIYVRGTLRTADLGVMRQGLILRSLAGTVYVSGNLDSSGVAGAGQTGGPLTIVAQRVVIAGKVVSAGGSGPMAGTAGAITFVITQGLSLSGTVDASGGDTQGQAVASGGLGGEIKIQAGGDIVLGGTVLIRGGAASSTASAATGGNAGGMTINCDGAVTLGGTMDGRGGIAMAVVPGGSVMGGASSTIKIGETAAPTAITVLVPLLITGGDGVAVGGGGGTAQLEPHGGDLRLAGMLDVSGGNSATKPGAGGNINGNPGMTTAGATGTAGVDIAGNVISNGGSITVGGAGDGARGGVIKMLVLEAGNMTLEPIGLVQTNGGQSGGNGTAGGGGIMYLFTTHGNASLHGQLLARGGVAPDAGGTGGGGGLVYVFTGNGHDFKSGTLIIETDGVIDASGGAGTVGGSARSDGHAHAVALFPVVQNDEFDVEQIAVLINSDGVHGSDMGWIANRGHIVARGGPANGNGGDVEFHGRQQDKNETPLPGNVDMAGDGTGAPGDFAGE